MFDGLTQFPHKKKQEKIRRREKDKKQQTVKRPRAWETTQREPNSNNNDIKVGVGHDEKKEVQLFSSSVDVDFIKGHGVTGMTQTKKKTALLKDTRNCLSWIWRL